MLPTREEALKLIRDGCGEREKIVGMLDKLVG